MTFRPRGKTRGENTCVFGVSSASFAAAGTPERPNKKKNRTTKKREGNGKTNKKVKTHINKKRQTNKQTDKQTDGKSNKQTNKQTKQTNKAKQKERKNKYKKEQPRLAHLGESVRHAGEVDEAHEGLLVGLHILQPDNHHYS